jgi:uncharacterized membrane protein YeaQ/YmgE (transglycosylase-associated protein family)
MLWDVIVWCVFGLVAGAIARLLVPGPDRMGCFGTIILGIVGSLVGGFLSRLIFRPPGDEFSPAGLFGAIVGGVIVLVIYRRLFRRRF